MQSFNKGNIIFENTIEKGLPHHSLIHQLILCCTFIICYVFVFDVKLDLNGDNFEYLNLAKAMLNGQGYAFPYSANPIPTSWFPPGYPSILALFMFFAGNAIILFKVINGIFFLGAVLLLYSIIKKITNNSSFSLVVCILLLLNCGLLRFSTIIMSEMPYLFFTALTLYYIMQPEEDVPFWKSKRFYLIVLFAVSSFYIRSIGIVLAGAIALHWFLQRKWKMAVGFLTGFALLYLPWIIRNSIYGIKNRYMGTIMTANAWRPEQGEINSAADFIGKMKVNFYDTVIRGFSEVLLPFVDFKLLPVSLIIVLGLVILFVLFLGIREMKKYRFLFFFYLLGNIFVFLMWHEGNFSRYVWPLAPFITFFFFYGVFFIVQYFFRRKKTNAPRLMPYSFLIVALFYIAGLKGIYLMAREKEYEPPHKNYFAMANYIKRLNNPELLVACRKPGMFYYFAGCHVTHYKDSESDREIITDFIDKKVDYLVLEKLGYSSVYLYMRPAVEKNMELFEVVFSQENPNTFLLKFNIEKARQKFNYFGGR